MQKIRNIIHGSIGKLKLDFITLCTPLCTAKQGLTSLQGFLSFFLLYYLLIRQWTACISKISTKKTCTTTPLFAFEIWICRICKGHFHKSTISPLLLNFSARKSSWTQTSSRIWAEFWIEPIKYSWSQLKRKYVLSFNNLLHALFLFVLESCQIN